SDASSSFSSSRVLALTSEAFISWPFLFCDALHEARAHRKLGRAETQRLAGDFLGHAVDLEHDAARLDARRPIIDGALALAHADFGRLRGDRQVREHPDPHATLTLHLAGDRAAGRLDLTRGDPVRLERLQAEAAEVQVGAALGSAVNTALELLAELCALWLQHRSSPKFLCLSGVFAATRTTTVAVGFDRLALGRHRVVLEDLALEHPHLDAADAVSRLRFGGAVVDIGAQRVQRHAAFTVPFHARDFRAAKATRAVDADTFGAQAHRRLNGALHGTTERDAALELLGDRLRDQPG